MALTIKAVSSLLIRGLASRNVGLLVASFGSRSFVNSSTTLSQDSKQNVGELSVQSDVVNEGGVEEYFSLSPSFEGSKEWTSKILSTMLVYPNFISTEEETEILKEIEPYLSRLHYESSHWDDAIHNYRETEKAKWNKRNTEVINRIRSLCFPPGVPQLRFVHILDLERNGVIKPHIDSVRFCGNTIAGVSLLSDSIMRLRHEKLKEFSCDILLPRLSLYIMRDFARYEFTHEILGQEESKFKEKVVTRDRRISIICRNEPDTATSEPVFKPLES